MAYAADILMATHSLLVRNGAGEDLSIASMIYNAAISALEVRAYRHEGTPPTLAQCIGTSPIRIFEVAVDSEGRVETLRATVHFETATLGFGFECDPGARDRNGNRLRDTEMVREVVILRGLRIEHAE